MNLAALAVPFLIALLLSLALGSKVIAALASAKARQPISDDAPEAHKLKHGTPTMGGVLIMSTTLVAILLAELPFFRLRERGLGGESLLGIGAVAAVFLGGGLVGLADDLGKVREKLNKAGLSERAKLTFQVLVAVLFAGYLAMTATPGVTTTLQFGASKLDLGYAYYGLAVLYLCFFGNAVNFTDGLDGLLSGTTLIVALTLGALAGGIVVPFYGAVAGACAGFLWFNARPAKVFMGDIGSLALGMGLAAAAMVAKQELLLLIVGIVYLLEIFSMMIQRYVFKYRRIKFGIEYAKANRVFRRAPLHHHFEELGWPETQVVARFYLIAMIAAAVGILVAPYLTGGPR